MEFLVYAKAIAELLALVQRLRADAKREGAVTDEELDAAIAEFDPAKYQDPLKT